MPEIVSAATPTPTATATPTPTSTLTATSARAPSCADFDRSGVVTSTDVLYVIRRFGSTDLTADLNNDGVVSAAMS